MRRHECRLKFRLLLKQEKFETVLEVRGDLEFNQMSPFGFEGGPGTQRAKLYPGRVELQFWRGNYEPAF